ncbi:Hypothetical predicted protein, partial [Scomber scombrus]
MPAKSASAAIDAAATGDARRWRGRRRSGKNVPLAGDPDARRIGSGELLAVRRRGVAGAAGRSTAIDDAMRWRFATGVEATRIGACGEDQAGGSTSLPARALPRRNRRRACRHGTKS